MSTDLTPDPEAPLPDSNRSENESQPTPAADIPVEPPAPHPAFPELPTSGGSSTSVKVVHMPAPFRLRTIVLSFLIFGIGGLYLGALNWKRLGKSERFWPTVILGTLGMIVLTFVYMIVGRLAIFDGALLGLAAELLGRFTIGGLIALLQRSDRQRWQQMSGRRTPALADVGGCRVYYVAYSLGALLSAFVRVVITPALLTFLSGTTFLTPQLTYSLGSFNVTYDSSWQIYAQEEEASVNCVTQGAIECLLAAENRLVNAGWIVMQVEDSGMSVAEVDERLVSQRVGDYTFGNPRHTHIDGHDAILRDDLLRHANGSQAQMTTVVIEDGADIIIMTFIAYVQDRELTEDRFQRILDSIDFRDT